jgi:ligand-binding sensor domain-containing protein
MRYVIAIVFCCFVTFCSAQQKNYTAFTVNDGLPSNHVYQCVEDNYGFLWIATDEGVARFDGKYFQVFTTANGLPDNEVIQIVKEKSGRIWVNCIRQSPAYFDEVKNRFINAKENTDLAKVSGTVNMNLFALPDSGVQYNNENGSFVFRNTRLDTIHSIMGKKFFRIGTAAKNLQIGFGGKYFSPKRFWEFYKIENGRLIDSTSFEFFGSKRIGVIIDEAKLYDFDAANGMCFIYTVQSLKPLTINVDTIKQSEPFSSFGVNDTTIFFVGIKGNISVYHKTTYKWLYTISGEYLANRLYEDSKGNQWIATVDKGLLLYTQKRLTAVTLPSTFTRDNFISITRNNGISIAGNYYGEVIETTSNRFQIHTVIKKRPSRQRKIIVAGKSIYTISEDGIYLNYTKPIFYQGNKQIAAGKTALLYDDTTMLVGSFAGILHLNTKTGKNTYIVRYKRGMALANGLDGLVYYGSTDGLHRYNVQQKTFESLGQIHPFFSERIVGIAVTSDSLVWVATAGSGVVVMKHDTIIRTINNEDGLLSNGLRTIATGKLGQIWLGTAQGISVINYTQSHTASVQFSVQNLSVNDGLSSNEINEMVFDRDTIYAATGSGISIIPTNFVAPKVIIPVRLIKMTINEGDTLITTVYHLDYGNYNIQMQYAGIALNGYFKKLQYRLGEKQDWLDVIGTTLTLRLTSGNHLIQVRAVDVNGYSSNKVSTINIEIATPFWKAIWFWFVVFVLVQMIMGYFIFRWQKKRRERKLAKEVATVQTAALEQQAFTSLMNPHFMFNALNSIQHYINVQDRQNANRYLSDFASLLRKSFEAAQQYFIPLETELENMKIYLRLEQMRFSNRFTYIFNISEQLDIEDWMIPTMMLQPLLENALLHGIMPSAIPGEIIVALKEEQESLIISITDNGIGVANSKRLQQDSLHKSHGTALIQKRIIALNHFSKQPITIHMMPAFDQATNPGNTTTISIPRDLYSAWIAAQQV